MKKPTEPCLIPTSMTDVYARTAPAIFAYARSRLSSPEQAEDILADVFLAALESDKFLQLQPAQQMAWLRRVTQNKIMDVYRLSGRQNVLTLEQLEQSLGLVSDTSPEHVVYKREKLRAIQTIIRRLPAVQQQILFLHFVDGLRSTEIAALIGKRDTAVRMLLSRALNKLRELYVIAEKGA